LFEDQLQVRRLDGIDDFLPEFREKLGNQAIAGEALAVFGFKKLFLDDAVCVDEEISRARKTLLHPGSFGVEDAVGADDLRVGIR
jgi:hypothetical protein